MDVDNSVLINFIFLQDWARAVYTYVLDERC